MRRLARCVAAVIGLALLAGPPAHAQTWPAKPLRMIVAFPPGGGTDIVGRILAAKLAEILGQQVVVDNRGGADGLIGTDFVAKAAPDGYTMLLGTAGNLAINPSLYRNVPFDVARDLAPVARIVSVDMMLTVNRDVPAKTVADLVALARAQPGRLNYGSTGVGGIPHLTAELFARTAGIDIRHVPYKGGGPALADLIAGHVQVYVQSVVQGAGAVKDGRVRALAMLGPQRSAILPDVPTMGETLPGYAATNWYGLMVPARTQAAIREQLHAGVGRAMRASDVARAIAAQGATPAFDTPEAFGAFLREETAKWATVIGEAGIRGD